MIGQQMPASFDAARPYEPTMLRAAHSAERTAYEISKGRPFNCVRGQGRITVEECRKRFESKNTICMRDCGCSIMATKKDILEKKPMPKRGTCSECGDGPMHLVSGRCYKCRQRSTLPPAASKSSTPAKTPPKSITPVQESRDDDQRVGSRVEEAGEKLREAIGADEDAAPDACQCCPEAAGPLVIDGMEFEAFTPRIKPDLKPFLSLQSGKTFNFSPGAVRQFGILRYRYVELRYSRSGRAIAFILHEQKPGDALSLFIPKAKDRARVGAQGFMSAFGLDLKGKGPWPLEQHQLGVLVARVG